MQTIIKYLIIETLNNDVDNVVEEDSLIMRDEIMRDERSSSNEQSCMRNSSNNNEDLLMEVDIKDKGSIVIMIIKNNYGDGDNDNNDNAVNPFLLLLGQA